MGGYPYIPMMICSGEVQHERISLDELKEAQGIIYTHSGSRIACHWSKKYGGKLPFG